MAKSPSTKTTGMADGRYLALTTTQLKALRAMKGDRARRDHVADLVKTRGCDVLEMGDAWWFVVWLSGNDLKLGKGLHKGQTTRIEWLEPAKVAACMAKLAKLDLKKAFFAIDEAKFEYSSVQFWVKRAWQEEGRTTVLDDHVFGRVKKAASKLASFVEAAAEDDKHLVFNVTY